MKALYRKYRPLKLADVIGQPQIVEVLTSALKSGKFSHAYLFTGPRGCGKTSVARIFAHEVNGFKYELEDSYVDILEIDGASNRGIDNIRELREKATIAPTEGKYKIYIIDEVHMLTKEAFNALLKTLEEPPSHVIFLMATTDLDRVPITILSRSQVLHFKLADPEIMVKHLKTIVEAEKIQISDDALKLLARRGGGSFRDTISLLDQISIMYGDGKTEISAEQVISALGMPRDDTLENILQAYDAQDFTKLTENLEKELDSGTSATLIASELISYLLKNPQASRLPLLKSLTSVEGAYPEAKLLLALSNAILTAPTPQTAGLPQSLPKTPQNASKMPQTAKTASKTTAKTSETPETPPKSASEALETASNGSFTAESYLAAIASASTSLGDILGKSEVILDGKTLKVTPEKKIYRSILKSPNNAKLLQKYLADGYSLEITDENSDALKKDPTLSQISDIMGNIQEVRSGQTDPF